ncbi:MAG: serine hydrolase domain-containing protein [Phenylobacterium sp.]|uniref:serine hydrolase domain-containing protein n=1 Tax=Phenylobacterium sp. TaxID=1871053 RepID=UPI002734FBDE|nr:serine hydrolase domain-containing protein [Phenylobacterium sp.]MDP3175440.1 serine hydrolase domain-containing protein [Phenylobacterium sp.]
MSQNTAADAPAGTVAQDLPIYNGGQVFPWSAEQQLVGYPAMHKLFAHHVVRHGDHVHPLPAAARQIEPTWSYDGRNWTLDEYMSAYRTSGVLVLKDGEVVLERYGLGRKPTDLWISFSVAKSLTSLLVGAAIQDGKIGSLHDSVSQYVPELKGSAYDGVSVRQMLMMSSGVAWNEDYTDPNSDVSLAAGRMSYMAQRPRAHPPGTVFKYNTGETDMVGVMLHRAVGKPLADYMSEKIWKPFGMEQDATWLLDAHGQERGGACMSLTLRDYGRIGLFVAGGGKAGGKQVVPEWYIAESTSVQLDNGTPPPGGYGYFWWIRPNGAYEAGGIFGQSVTTFKDEGLIIVVNSAWPAPVGDELNAARNALFESVRAAVK